MLNSLTNKVKTFIFTAGDNEKTVNVDRKRKRPFEESVDNDRDIQLVTAVKKQKLQSSGSSSVIGGFFSTATVQKMSDWVQKKTSMFRWGSEKSKSIPHNGNGRLDTNGRNGGYSRSSTHHGFTKVGVSSTWPVNDSVYHSQQQALSRGPIHTSSTRTSSVQTDAKEEPPGLSRSASSYNKMDQLFQTRNRCQFTARESIKLDEKVRYQQLLQKFTTVPLEDQRGADGRPGDSIINPVRVSQLPSSNASILGSTISQDLQTMHLDKSRAPERLKMKVQPSHKSTPRPAVNGFPHPADDTLLHLTDISAIASVQTDSTSYKKQPLPTTIDLTDEPEEELKPMRKSSVPPRNLKSPTNDFRDSKFLNENWIKDLNNTYSSKARERERQLAEVKIKAQIFDERRHEEEVALERKIRSQMRIYRRTPAVVDDLPVEISSSEDEAEEEKESAFPELTDEMEKRINVSLRGNPSDVLVDKFRLQITKNDIATLGGLNWLNDEVINFYMNLLMERGEKGNNPKVYAFNTFFYPKVMSGGQSAVKRWTRRVDVLAVDYILIPVHLGMHWCLAVINFKKKDIQYYDSMGGNNTQCLNALKKYLCDESLDKKKKEFDLSGWKSTIVKDIPQQMNGSDCGMFACKYAEYITREASISFTQEHMPYFRRRMVYEIVTANLLQ